MAYLITYETRFHEQGETEWITPAGWSERRVREVFEKRHGVTVTSVREIKA